jgi:hypothetical protein
VFEWSVECCCLVEVPSWVAVGKETMHYGTVVGTSRLRRHREGLYVSARGTSGVATDQEIIRKEGRSSGQL